MPKDLYEAAVAAKDGGSSSSAANRQEAGADPDLIPDAADIDPYMTFDDDV